MRLRPVSLDDANAFIVTHHRHHGRVVGHKWSVGIERDGELVGVAVVGRPVARRLDDGTTLEVTRCCVLEGVQNGCSMLYGAAWRAAKAMGYARLVTYTLKDELGVSLAAAGWKCMYETPGGSWSCPSRPRSDKHPLGAKLLWEAQ